jgi:2-aminoadipate transaminase
MAPMNYETLYAERAHRARSSVIRELLKLGSQPGIISLGGGMPDPALFPVKLFKECMDYALEQRPNVALQYGETAGYMPLKEALVTLSEKDGIKGIDTDNVLVTSGSQQGIDFMAKMFIEKGDTIITEAPTYLSAVQAFDTFGAQFVTIPIDEHGADIDILEKKLADLHAKGIKAKFFYTIPTFQNPAGASMSLVRRKKLLALANQYDLLIIEDNPYGDLRYSGEALPPLVALDDQERVIYLRTFSKILAPGIRLAWIVAPKIIISKINLMKQSTDLCSPAITQVATAEYLKRDYLWPHLEIIKKSYAHKAEVMYNAIRKDFPSEIQINQPDGGMFIWAIAPEKINASTMFREAVDKGVAYILGSAFYPDGTGHNTMRLNFTMQTPENIEEGIHRLSLLLKEKLAG